MKISYYSLVLLFSLALWGCSSSNSSAPPVIDTTTGKHAAGWAVNGSGGAHPFAYFANSISCEECHGKPSDPAGGISRVSCSNPGRSGVACHPSFPHVPGFAAYAKHGSAAKDVASGVTGMAHCKQCHGSGYTGAGLAPSCIACHKETTPSSNAPHAANWVSGNANGLRHSSTDATNATACAQCHLGGTYSHKPPAPAPAGTAPGCFNGTLCHNNASHALPYVTGHQADAKANLASCQPCHAIPASGANPRFNLSKGTGVLNPNGCEGCHNRPGLAHPYMWLPGRGTTQTPSGPVTNSTSHANAGTVNASCGLCHGGTPLAGGGSAPSCFPASSINGTTCHFTKPVDAAGMSVGCVSCHGTPPNGTSFPNTANAHAKHAFACAVCHNGTGSGTPLHSTRNAAAVSFLPSQAGATATYDATAKTCLNVICHDGRTTTPAWTSSNNGCTACHISPSINSTGQSLVRHSDHFAAISAITCDACHTGDGPGLAAPHPNGIPVMGFPTIINGSTVNFNENGLTAVYDPTAQKCTNLSCHGGKDVPFPAWKGVGVFNPNDLNRCGFSCHTISLVAPASYVGPYIGPFSGNPISAGGLTLGNLHYIHLSIYTGASEQCAICHALPVPGHYAGIMGGRRLLRPGDAAGTVGGAVMPELKVTSYSYSSATGKSSCTTVTGCHTILPVDPRSWY